MGWTTIDLDDDALHAVMARYGFTRKSDAVNFALRMARSETSVDPIEDRRGRTPLGRVDRA